jgi:hypothetical protein
MVVKLLKVFLIIIAILFCSRAEANILISEVFYDAVGSDTGKEWVELYNDSTTPFDLAGYELNASSGDYYVFSNVVEAKKCVIVHWNTEGTNTQIDLYTGSAGFSNMGNTSGWVALFSSSEHNSSTIVDYLEYGAGGQTWESAAVSAGIWMAGDYVVDVEEGHSLEYLGTGNSSLDWRDQPNPTPGSFIPEPATLVLMSSGLLPILIKRKRERINKK